MNKLLEELEKAEKLLSPDDIYWKGWKHGIIRIIERLYDVTLNYNLTSKEISEILKERKEDDLS